MTDNVESGLNNVKSGGKEIGKIILDLIIPEEHVLDPTEQFLLPEKFLEKLQPALNQIGFPLDETPAVVTDLNNIEYKYYRIIFDQGHLALLFFYNKSLQDSNSINDMVWIGLQLAGGGTRGICAFSDSDYVADSYITLENNYINRFKWELVKFYNKNTATSIISANRDVRANLLKQRLGLGTLFRPHAQPSQPSTPEPSTPSLTYKELINDQTVRDQIADILSRQASAAPQNLDPKGYLEKLINGTKWDSNWKSTLTGGLTNDANNDSLVIINYATNKGSIQGENITAIGDLLEELLEDLGTEDSDEIKKFIAKYHLSGN